ncbi:hypothetical protein EV359DRAFT_65476 [Lentinula novae-zelandiae]|nr:hypothetical protein EV359DRAFT_65476 [Lentinula novae-zelandiae]
MHSFKKFNMVLLGTAARLQTRSLKVLLSIGLPRAKANSLYIVKLFPSVLTKLTLDRESLGAHLLVSPKDSDDWNIQILTEAHDGDNEREVERASDTPVKQPPELTRRILYNLFPGFHDTSPWDEFLARNRTPPYLYFRKTRNHSCSLE